MVEAVNIIRRVYEGSDRGDLSPLLESLDPQVVERPPSTRRAQRLAECSSRVGGQVSGVNRAGVEGAEGGDAGFPGGPAGRVGAVGSGSFGCGVDHGGEVGGGELGQVSVAEQSGREAPAGAIGRRGGRSEGRRDLVDPNCDGDRLRGAGGGGDEVGDGEPEGACFLE